MVGTSLASFDFMMETMMKQFNGTNGFGGNRAINTAAEFFSVTSQLNGYACWCLFDGEARGKAKGTPLDDFDGVCRRLNWAYQCVMFDSAQLGDADCIPWDVTYTAPNQNPAIFDADIATQCGTENPGATACVINTCIAEMQFIRDINFIFFDSLLSINQIFRHTDPNFIHLDNCPGFNHFSVLNLDCCGRYDNSVGRKPFNAGVNNERACCVGPNTAVTYLDALFLCCPDFTVQLSC